MIWFVRLMVGLSVNQDALVQGMIRVADTDGSGVIEFNEFMELMCDSMDVSFTCNCINCYILLS